MKKVFIKTFGCQMNEYDSEKMADVLLDQSDYQETKILEEADMVLLNTCSIREKAQDKVFSDLGRLRDLKVNKPDLLIGVGGCVASQEGRQIISRAPFVDLVFGPQTLHRLPALLTERARSGRPQVDISFPEIEKFDHLPPAKKDGGAAFVSIMEGCSKYCSYCVVPYTRGEEVSRPFESILEEVSSLTQQGVCEITLLGQNVNAYLGKLDGQSELADFAMLLEYIAEIPGVERLRYTTSHPREFTQRLITAHVQIPQLVNHLHLPVQHGSDKILMAMKRGYTCLEYKSLIRKIRQAKPNIPISSDFIVGFPDESDADFQATIDLIEEIKFAQAYSFKYSRRPGTPATAMKSQVSETIKAERLAILQTLIDHQLETFNASCVGREFDVLLTHAGRHSGQLVGRSPYLQPVYVNADKQLIGQVVKLRMTEVATYSLGAELIDAKAA